MTASSTTTKITKPVRYRDFIIAPRNQGFDLIDPASGCWTHFDSQRFAKWSASFISNISTRMTQHAPLPANKIPHIKES